MENVNEKGCHFMIVMHGMVADIDQQGVQDAEVQ
jgi:hypothetical protein